MNPQGQPVYVLAPQQQQQRPVLAWIFAAVMAVLAANGGKLPTLPALPPFPFPAAPATPPAPAPTAPAAPAPGMPAPVAPVNPVSAICRIQFGNAGCTAATINVWRGDGRVVMLTAAHCVNAVGAKGKATFKDGRVVAVSVVARDATSDCAFLLTDAPAADLPVLKIAERSPAPGAKVWHAGYGIDRPANREDGARVDVTTASGKIGFKLSVSSGDSGGPIILTDTGEVVSCVCCTESRGQVATMYGASTERVRELLARATAAEDWTPAELPAAEPGT